MKQLGLALHSYHNENGIFPRGITETLPPQQRDPRQWISWLSRILPWIEQAAVFQDMERAYQIQINQGGVNSVYPWSNPPHTGLSKVLTIYRCPSDQRQYAASLAEGITVAFTGYLGCNGTNLRTLDGILYWNSKVRMADIADGTSNTFLVGERPPSADLVFGWWYAGAGQWDTSYNPLHNSGSCDVTLGGAEINIHTSGFPAEDGCPTGPYKFSSGTIFNQCDQFHVWSMHSGGANFLFADGSCHFLTYEIGQGIVNAMSTRNGGEPVKQP
jgi:prepilin-type processing-associated H-X9-DG protein